jgi:hypothetical protein
VVLVDRRICRLLAFERQAEDRLAGGPDDPTQADQPGRLEDVVRAQGLRKMAENLL